MNWLQEPILVFDTETTGLRDPIRIVQLSLLRYEMDKSWSEMEAWVNLCSPSDGVVIEPGATLVHGITMETVKGKPTLEQLMDGILAILCRHNVFMAYNGLNFDIPLLRAAFKRSKSRKDFPAIESRTIDPLPFSYALYPGARGWKLGQMAARLSINSRRTHEALSDCMTAAEVMTRMAVIHELPNDLDAILNLQDRYQKKWEETKRLRHG